ncbi:MAG: hypothetical protein ACFFEF_05285 [Candidatus Thorarchaeota archaeon]
MTTTQREASFSTMTVRQMMSLWWREKWVRGLVIALSPIGLVDAVFTILLFQVHGPEYEYNPLVRLALSSEWWFAWVLIDVFSFVIFAMIAGSYYLHTRSSIFGNHTGWFAALIAFRVGAVVYNILLYYLDLFPIFWGAISAILTYYYVSKLLSRNRDMSIRGFKRYWRAKYDRLHDKLLTRGVQRKDNELEIKAVQPIGPEYDNRRIWMLRAGYLSMAIIVFASIPFMLTTIGILTGGIYWNELFGGSFYWNELSAQTFIVGFFTIIIFTAIIMFLILKAFTTTEGAW